jgi:hypothetical protein
MLWLWGAKINVEFENSFLDFLFRIPKICGNLIEIINSYEAWNKKDNFTQYKSALITSLHLLISKLKFQISTNFHDP